MGKKQVVAIQLALAFVGEHEEEFEKWVKNRSLRNSYSHLDKVMKDGGSPDEKV